MKQLAGGKHMENDYFPRTLKFKMFFINMQNTFSNKKQKSIFDTINNNNSNLCFVKGMRYSKKTFFITYLTNHFTFIAIKKILLYVPTSATATRLALKGPILLNFLALRRRIF
jgi:hypothetical protein